MTDIGQGVIIFSSTLIPDSFDDPIGGILRIYIYIYIYIYLKHNYFYFNNELICLLFYLSVISSLIVFGFFFNDMLILNFTQYFNQSIYNEYNTQKCIRILVYIFSNLCLYKLNNNIFFKITYLFTPEILLINPHYVKTPVTIYTKHDVVPKMNPWLLSLMSRCKVINIFHWSYFTFLVCGI